MRNLLKNDSAIDLIRSGFSLRKPFARPFRLGKGYNARAINYIVSEGFVELSPKSPRARKDHACYWLASCRGLSPMAAFQKVELLMMGALR